MPPMSNRPCRFWTKANHYCHGAYSILSEKNQKAGYLYRELEKGGHAGKIGGFDVSKDRSRYLKELFENIFSACYIFWTIKDNTSSIARQGTYIAEVKKGGQLYMYSGIFVS